MDDYEWNKTDGSPEEDWMGMCQVVCVVYEEFGPLPRDAGSDTWTPCGIRVERRDPSLAGYRKGD